MKEKKKSINSFQSSWVSLSHLVCLEIYISTETGSEAWAPCHICIKKYKADSSVQWVTAWFAPQKFCSLTSTCSIDRITISQLLVCIYYITKKKGVLSLKRGQGPNKWGKSLRIEMALPCRYWPSAFNLWLLRDLSYWRREWEERERDWLSPTKN